MAPPQMWAGATADGLGDRGQGPGGGMMAGPRGPMGRGAGRGNSLEGKRIRITRGFDKGKVGTVKEESDSICRVETSHCTDRRWQRHSREGGMGHRASIANAGASEQGEWQQPERVRRRGRMSGCGARLLGRTALRMRVEDAL